MKSIVALIVLIGICIGGIWEYQRYKKDQALTDGSYTCVGCLPPDKAAAYDRYDHGDGPDPEVGRRSSFPVTPLTNQTSQYGQSSQSASASDNPAGYASAPINRNQTTPVIIQPTGSQTVTASTSLNNPDPVRDSMASNPQNGLRFAGSGSYQWYREGNLTWRINTQTGASCIIYATMEEWRKRIVMEHGCGRST